MRPGWGPHRAAWVMQCRRDRAGMVIMHLTGPAIDRDQQMAHVKKAFDRLAKLGTQIVVFGSGGARQVPDGFPKEEAFQQLVDFGRRIAPEARARGITVTIEPLRRQETNIINSAGEGLQLVEAINDPNFQLMVDFYHLASEQEDPSIIQRASAHIRHLHMANPTGRVFPRKWDEYNYAPFFANLRKIGYDKRMSIEATAKDYAHDAPLSIALLRRSTFRAKRRASSAPLPDRSNQAPQPGSDVTLRTW